MRDRAHMPSADLDDAAAALADAIAKAEVEVVGAELADHGRLVAVAEAEGVTPATFGQEDLRLIHCAAAEARHLPLVDVLRLVRRALQKEHFWDPQGPFGTGCQWSDETLVQLAQSYPASVVATRANARHLLALVRRWRMAEDLLSRFRQVLTGDGPVRTLTPPPRPSHQPAPRRTAFLLTAPGKRGVA
jgi:hypothetical protein